MAVRTIEWRNGRVVMLDQRLLPTREVYRVYSDHREVARAIKDMVIRGAPAIGVAAAMGIALGARTLGGDFGRHFERLCRTFKGARLTAWELKKDRIPVTLVTDNMAGHLMQRGRVSCVIVGTDRTAANGDVANKIGTYTLAALANRHSIPFYVAAPISSIDFACPDGTHIPIEERAPREVTHVFDRQIAPSGARVPNPAFDVTPAELVSAIVTERGVARQPLAPALARLVSGRARRRAGRVERSLEPRRERRR